MSDERSGCHANLWHYRRQFPLSAPRVPAISTEAERSEAKWRNLTLQRVVYPPDLRKLNKDFTQSQKEKTSKKKELHRAEARWSSPYQPITSRVGGMCRLG